MTSFYEQKYTYYAFLNNNDMSVEDNLITAYGLAHKLRMSIPDLSGVGATCYWIPFWDAEMKRLHKDWLERVKVRRGENFMHKRKRVC
jgi:hypothetical protein